MFSLLCQQTFTPFPTFPSPAPSNLWPVWDNKYAVLEEHGEMDIHDCSPIVVTTICSYTSLRTYIWLWSRAAKSFVYLWILKSSRDTHPHRAPWKCQPALLCCRSAHKWCSLAWRGRAVGRIRCAKWQSRRRSDVLHVSWLISKLVTELCSWFVYSEGPGMLSFHTVNQKLRLQTKRLVSESLSGYRWHLYDVTERAEILNMVIRGR